MKSRCGPRFTFHGAALLLPILWLPLAGLQLHAADADPDPAIPETLAPWRERAYTRRYFLRVEAPGEAGATGLQPDPPAASVILPLKILAAADGQPERPEKILLLGEDGAIHPVLARKVAGGSEAEIAFATRPGLRRFCLYAGAPPDASVFSPATFQAKALNVELRGRSIPEELAWRKDNPLTLDRFMAIAAHGGGSLGEKSASRIDDPECPWFQLKVDASGHVKRRVDPKRYGAVYEAFLRTPIAGRYRFAVDTPGCVQLLVNGKAVLGAENPDDERAPFALHGGVELNAGVQRLTLYYAEANGPSDRTNAERARFGLRLHWQPPGVPELLCIPAQAFPRALPAVVARCEALDAGPQPFIHAEVLGQVRAGREHGPLRTREWAWVVARAVGAPDGARLSIGKNKAADGDANDGGAGGADGEVAAAWTPVAAPIAITLKNAAGSELLRREFTWPDAESGARDVMDLEAELLLKSAPEFLYPDETAQFHLESSLCPAPKIIPKERRENNLLPPAPRPMGEFSVAWWLERAASSSRGPWPQQPLQQPLDGTQIERAAIGRVQVPRDKQRISIPGETLEKYASSGDVRLRIQLAAGGVSVDGISLRLLHSRSPHWPENLRSGAGSLLLLPAEAERPAPPQPDSAAPAAAAASAASLLAQRQLDESRPGVERVLIVVPREQERDYRRFAPLKALSVLGGAGGALFIGDPLVEDAAGGEDVSRPASETAPESASESGKAKPVGLAARVRAAFPRQAWSFVLLPGPQRQLPIYRLLAALEKFSRGAPNGRFPKTVVLSLGGGDAARQTPLYLFERGLDVAIDRLRLAGAQRIVVLGEIPEPFREKQCEPYQDHLNMLLRQHHIEGIDLFHLWTRESDWARRFELEGGSDALYGATPNAAALDEITRLLKERL